MWVRAATATIHHNTTRPMFPCHFGFNQIYIPILLVAKRVPPPTKKKSLNVNNRLFDSNSVENICWLDSSGSVTKTYSILCVRLVCGQFAEPNHIEIGSIALAYVVFVEPWQLYSYTIDPLSVAEKKKTENITGNMKKMRFGCVAVFLSST